MVVGITKQVNRSWILIHKKIINEYIESLLCNKQWINHQYNVIQKSVSSLAKELCVSCYIVQKFIKFHGFSIRSSSEQVKTTYTRKTMSYNHADVSGNKNPRYGITMSEETKQKISEKNKNPSIDTRKKMSIAHQGINNPCFGRNGKLHPLYKKSPSEETRRRLSESHKGLLIGTKNPMYGKTGTKNPFFGRHHTEESKRKMLLRPRISGKDHCMYGKPTRIGTGYGKGSYFITPDNLVIWLRSSYELRIANLLTILNISWKYEYKAFDLITLSPYHPDFYLSKYNIWWEIKGYMTDIAKQKLSEFKQLYPNKVIRILYNEDIQVLEYLVKNNAKFNIYSIGHSL